MVGKPAGGGRPQARRRSRRLGRSPRVSTESKRPAAVRVRFAEISGASGAGSFGGWRIFGKEVTCRGRAAAGPAAEPPPRAEPEGFDGVETACGRVLAPCRDLQREMSRSRWVRAADLPGKPLENAEKPHKIFDKP